MAAHINVAKCVWLEEKMSELTARLARFQLELEAMKPTWQKGSRCQKRNGGYWHAEERSRGHGGRCQKRWLGEHSSKARRRPDDYADHCGKQVMHFVGKNVHS